MQSIAAAMKGWSGPENVWRVEEKLLGNPMVCERILISKWSQLKKKKKNLFSWCHEQHQIWDHHFEKQEWVYL